MMYFNKKLISGFIMSVLIFHIVFLFPGTQNIHSSYQGSMKLIHISDVTGIVETIGDVSDIWITRSENVLKQLPQNILNRFVCSGYHFYITDEDIAMTEYNGTVENVAGITRYGQYIKIEDRQYAVDEAILHEFGHFVFDECENWNRQEIKNAFDNEIKNAGLMNITYGLDDMIEFYAEIFQKYIKDPETTAQIFPEFTALIKADIKSL